MKFYIFDFDETLYNSLPVGGAGQSESTSKKKQENIKNAFMLLMKSNPDNKKLLGNKSSINLGDSLSIPFNRPTVQDMIKSIDIKKFNETDKAALDEMQKWISETGGEHFNEFVETIAKATKDESDSKTFLVTGRASSSDLKNEIKNLLNSNGIVFNDYYFGYNSASGSKSKQAAILEIIKKYGTPEEIIFYDDDKEKYLKPVDNFFKHKHENNDHFGQIEIKCDHITIFSGGKKLSTFFEDFRTEFLNKESTLTGYVIETNALEGISALRVSRKFKIENDPEEYFIPSTNSDLHVTLAIRRDSNTSASESNEILKPENTNNNIKIKKIIKLKGKFCMLGHEDQIVSENNSLYKDSIDKLIAPEPKSMGTHMINNVNYDKYFAFKLNKESKEELKNITKELVYPNISVNTSIKSYHVVKGIPTLYHNLNENILRNIIRNLIREEIFYK